MIICKRKSNNQIINDFQPKATQGTLIANAVRAGLGDASEFEEIEVTQDEFNQYVFAFKESFRVQREKEVTDRKKLEKSIKDKFIALGFTAEELKFLLQYAD